MKQSNAQRPTPSDKDLSGTAPFLMTHRQAASLVASTIIGVGVLTLPRTTAQLAAQNGWISTVLGAIFAMVSYSIIIVLSGRHPGQTIVAYAAELLSPRKARWVGIVLGTPFMFLLILFWTENTALVARVFGEVVITTVLTRTPLEVIISTMLITAFIFVMHDIEVLVRVNEVLIPLIVIPLLIIGLSSLQSAQLVNLLPLFRVDFSSFLKGVAITATSYLGYDVMMIFGAYTEHTGKPIRHQVLGIAIPGIIYSLIAFSGIAVFGADEIKLLAWPTLELVKTTEVPGLILERMESAFLAVWVAAVFTSLGNFYYATSMLIKELLHLKNHRWPAVILLPIFYYLSLIPPNMQTLFNVQSKWNIMGYTTGVGLPFFFLLLSLWRKQKKSPGGQAA